MFFFRLILKELVDYLLEKRDFKFLLTSRLTQDCVENLFSVIRQKNAIPNALQFKHNLKLISVSMYMRSIESGNYDFDD